MHLKRANEELGMGGGGILQGGHGLVEWLLGAHVASSMASGFSPSKHGTFVSQSGAKDGSECWILGVRMKSMTNRCAWLAAHIERSWDSWKAKKSRRNFPGFLSQLGRYLSLGPHQVNVKQCRTCQKSLDRWKVEWKTFTWLSSPIL